MLVTEPRSTPGKATPLQVVKAVLSAFIGIRKGAAHDRDIATIRPVQVIIAGIIAAALMVLAVVLLVTFITS
jgi:hypothetical protein